MGMGRLFNETFFRFLLGFVAIVMLSLVLLVVASQYMGGEDLTGELETCPPGDVC